MECLYLPDIHAEAQFVTVCDEEFRHARALRFREGSGFLVSNGVGLCAVCEVRELHRDHLVAECIRFFEEYNESPFRFHLCIGILDNKDRMEYVVEKSVELGVRSITFVQTRFSGSRSYNLSRLQSKAIAAMKQSCRSRLPELRNAPSLEQVVASTDIHYHILCDTKGSRPDTLMQDTCFYVGPEGGFHADEIALLSSMSNFATWHLASARLRAETAAIAALSHAAAFR